MWSPSVLRRGLVTASTPAADVIVVGAGVVGVATAHYLARRGARVTIVDERPPLSYTSSLSTECYRNYWSDHAPMTAFMNRSIDLLEARAAECDNAFSMNRRGYCFLTRTAEGAARHAAAASAASRTGIGGGTVHADGGHGVVYRGATLPYDAVVDGLTVFQGTEAIDSFFTGSGLPPFVAPEVASMLHCGRCGWMNAQQMGAQLLDVARAHGVRTIVPAALVGVTTQGQGAAARITGALLRTPDDPAMHMPCAAVVNAAGPYAAAVNALLAPAASAGGSLPPLENEVHAKVGQLP